MSPKPLYKAGDIAYIIDGRLQGHTCIITTDEPYVHLTGWIYFVEIKINARIIREVVMERTLVVHCSRKKPIRISG